MGSFKLSDLDDMLLKMSDYAKINHHKDYVVVKFNWSKKAHKIAKKKVLLGLINSFKSQKMINRLLKLKYNK